MRQLKFTAQRDKTTEAGRQDTQSYVTNLLTAELGQYGFQTETQQDQIAIRVQDHPVALGVSCQSPNEQGDLVCVINAFADESQDWFQKIETQSVIKQLAQAVEETLKKDNNLKDFEWKKGDKNLTE